MRPIQCLFRLAGTALFVGLAAAAQKPTDLTTTAATVKIGGRDVAAMRGRLVVPENRTKKDSPTIELAFVRLETRAESPLPPVFFLPGVPGSATAMAESARWTPILEHQDVILLDQRGMGESKPRLLFESAAFHPELLFRDQAGATRHMVQICAEARKAFDAQRVDLAAYNAEESADDIDDLRAALGIEKIVVVGHSYGSHLALAYLRRHEAHVARIVGVATAGPDDVHKLPSELDASLRRLAALVREDPATAEQVPDLFALFERVGQKLEREPVTVKVLDPRTQAEVSIPVGRFGLQWILLRDLGDVRDLPVLPRLLHTLDSGDVGLLTWFVHKRYTQHSPLEVGMYAMRASSGASKERWKRIDEEAKTSPFGRARTLFSPEIDAALGVRARGESFRAPLKSAVPALFVSGTLDANAPPEQTERIAAGFANGVQLVVENAGHEDIMSQPQARQRFYDFIAGRAVEGGRVVAPALRFAPVEGAVPAGLHPALDATRR